MKEQLKEFVVEALSSNLDAMKGVFNTVVNNLIEKNDALEAMVTTWKEKIVELKGELTVYKGINELTKATIEAESFVKLGCKKDKFDSFKLKEMSNGGGNHEEEHDKNNNDGSAMNGVNMKPHNEKKKTNDHLRSKKNEKKLI
ncbi:hypothetical protein Gohar_026575 [Gossypium harknessii]|uniref:Uncharacterized protein n=1 Tax=Gossypium harknessii TaxID=34285 RepID=A0A7J9HS34_9ROSI|nr:hypothetical protein [Gossypium harknessii]